MSRAAPPKPPPDTSNERNQYIPSFIAEKPFWAGDDESDYLEHQRLHSEPKDTLDRAKWYDRGKKSGPAATKYRKGACENCGAMTHKTKDCLSRPRKQGAKWTGRDIQADEVVEDVKLGWDAKRDRWNGYDAREYDQVIKEYQDMETLKQATDTSTPDPTGDTDAKYGEETDMGRSQPTSTRQLRLREDTAKYLLDLNLETSAKYDPKTRSMDTTSQALSNTQDRSADDIVSDGFVRPTSTNDDAAAFERAQRYAWETQESTSMPSNQKLHLQANPTEGAVLLKKREQEESDRKAAQQAYLLEKYGTTSSSSTSTKPTTSSTSTTVPKAILSSESYIEYDSTGRPIGQQAITSIPRSKYPEDIHPNNHTSVFGSWWSNFQWGYACCHSTVKNSYCTGEEGIRAFEEAEGRRTGKDLLALTETARDGAEVEKVDGNEKQKLEMEQNGDDVAERKDGDVADTSRTKSSSGRDRNEARKRTLQEIQSGVTEEEMESYKRNKLSADDPMSSLLGRDELVE